MTDVSVRVATQDDAEDVALLYSEFNALLGVDGLPESRAYDPTLVQVSGSRMARRIASMEGIETVLLAETPNGTAGLCCLRLVPYIGQDELYAEMTQLYVRPAFQRRGVGTALLGAAEDRSIAAGATCVHIVTGRGNEKAQAFYAARGYRSDDVVFDKYFSLEEAHA